MDLFVMVTRTIVAAKYLAKLTVLEHFGSFATDMGVKIDSEVFQNSSQFMLTLWKQKTKVYPRANHTYHQIHPRPQDSLARGHLPCLLLHWLWGSCEAALSPRPGFLVWKETLGLVYVINELWSKLRSRPRSLYEICQKLMCFRQFCLISEVNKNDCLSYTKAVTSILIKVRVHNIY